MLPRRSLLIPSIVRTIRWCARVTGVLLLIGLTVLWVEGDGVSRRILIPHRANAPHVELESKNSRVFVRVTFGWPFEERFQYICGLSVSHESEPNDRCGFALSLKSVVVPPLDQISYERLVLAGDPRATDPATRAFSLKTYTAVVPYWCLCLLASIPMIPPTTRYVIHLHRKRQGLCVSCGFNLRATPDRCPECGRRRTHTN
jgi:hypothetical protein